MNRRRHPDDRTGRALAPYVALIALAVVAGVAGFAVFERWMAAAPATGVDAALDGAGRVVIGSRPTAPLAGGEPTNTERVYKPEEFTFYRTLSESGSAEPQLAPPQPPARPSVAQSSPAKPIGVTRGVGAKTYTVQAGSFVDRRSADRLAGRLRRHRQPVTVTRIVLPEAGVRYRVRVGQFKRREDALKFAATIQKADRLEPFVAAVVP